MKLKIKKSRSDESIVNGCRNNDPKAQQMLYDKYAGRLLGLCCRYVSDRAEAEDVMICSLMKVFEKIEQFKGDGSFEGWIRRITVNECLTYLRRNKAMYLEVEIEKADREPDYKTLSTNLETEDLLRLIQELPMGYRTIFNLYALEGYSHKEIAKTLNININTSKSQLSRARSLLQKQLLEIEQRPNKKIYHHE